MARRKSDSKSKVQPDASSSTNPISLTQRHPALTYLPPFFLALTALFRFWLLSGADPAVSSDTKGYQRVLEDGIWSNLFFQGRPCGYPLFLKLMDMDLDRVVLAQRLIAIAAWFFWAWSLGRSLRNFWAGLAASIAVFLYGCSANVLYWDNFILTESLTLSTYCLLAGLLLIMLHRPDRPLIPTAIAAAGLYLSLLRDSNVYLLPGLIAFLTLAPLLLKGVKPLRLEWHGRRHLLLARYAPILVLLVAFFFLRHENKAAGRWENPLFNSLNLKVFLDRKGNQIQLNRDHFLFFVRHHGMPQHQALKQVGNISSRRNRSTPDYFTWLERNGYSAYIDFLKQHPRYVWNQLCPGNGELGKLLSDSGKIYLTYGDKAPVAFEDSHIDVARNWQDWVYGLLGWWLTLTCPLPLSALIGLAALAGFVFICLRHPDSDIRPRTLLGLLCFFAYSFTVLVAVALVGDAIETWRHALLGIVSGFLMSLMTLSLALDAAVVLIARHLGNGIQPGNQSG